MREDIERWNRKYLDRRGAAQFEPDELLVRNRRRLDGHGRALDLACGVGHNALFLAEAGYECYGIDGSIEGLRLAAAQARARQCRLRLLAADLDVYPLPERHFRVIVVSRFLNRERVPALEASLAPGGLLLYQTFNRNFLTRKPGFNARYVLEFGELLRLFSTLEPIETNEPDPGADVLSHLVARKRR